MQPPPPPDSPPHDSDMPPPPPGPPPPIDTKRKTTRPRRTKTKTPSKDLDAYTDESDVFEEDVEAILFAEEEEDRRKGYTDCLTETQLDSTEYPYPAYLAKLSTLFTEQSAFGKIPEDFIYCNNLLVSPSQLKLLDTRAAALEQEKFRQTNGSTGTACKEA
ncbi:uncharacterized protein PITG_12317 [Phytophthora infestans T30-4]|uniref:Uncharacterized protein n=1 Tax=Phytophthora infestans (strain T30-4) TaxID=403677 RepID=D0NJK9_PHYIT|nr:uncharacterized protein PITG_12317 [Phytophthora infestans T30-4]EEY59727.1 conserved hypothetical protein [Phytophthora infestans T30-4]|eukprot:XP_002900920.1 conserved hypothetical protein [Phytophthora infestans T30-4]